MLTTTQVRVEPRHEEAPFPSGRRRSGGRCACGGTPDHTGECAACRRRRLARERADGMGGRQTGPGSPAATAHDFGRMRVLAGLPPAARDPYTLTADVKTDRRAIPRGAFMSADGGPDPSLEKDREAVRLAQSGEAGPLNTAASTVGSVAGGVIGGIVGGGIGAAAGAAAGRAVGSAVAAAAACTYSITYANQSTLGCGARCGAKIQFDVTRVTATGSGCPSLNGLRVTESVTTDNGCGPGSVTTGAGCPIGPGGAVTGCTDVYALCLSPASVPMGGCTEAYTQRLFVGGQHAETRTITFRLTKTSTACSGTVTRT